MATIANPYNPNDPNNNANAGGGGTVMPSTGGGAASSGGGGSSTPSSSTTPYQPPNVSQYLAANQGAGQQLTTGITNNIQNQADKVNSQVNSNQNNLNNQYNSLNSNLNTNTANQVAQTAFQNPQQLLDSYNAAKTSSSSQPLSSDQQSQANQYNQFQQLNNGGYNQGIQNYGNQAQQVNNQLQGQLGALTQQTGSAANEMGRNQLLQNTVGQGGNYNQGEQTLDSLFLQGSPNQRNANGLSNLQQLQQNLGGIGNQTTQNVQGLNLDTQNKLSALQGLSAGDQANIKNLFLNGGQGGQGLNQIGQNVQNEYNTAKQNADTTNAAFQNAFQTGNYTPEQLDALGLKTGQQTWGLTGADIQNAAGYQANPLADYSQGGAAAAATPEEFARYNALNQLAGGANGLQNNIFGSSTQAGGYNPYTLANGQQGANNAINQQAQLYGVTKVNDLIDQLRNSGGFNGASSGSGMRGADPAAQYRQAMGAALSNLESGSQAKNATTDPNQYYNQVVNAVNQAWGGSGANPGDNATINQLLKYGNTLNGVQSDVIGGPSALPTDPTTGQIDWSKINAPQGK